jgi:hypothetical protein
MQMSAQRTEIILFIHGREHIRREPQADALKHGNDTEKLLKK